MLTKYQGSPKHLVYFKPTAQNSASTSEGIMLTNEARDRAGLAVIGSIGGGGVVAHFGFMPTPAMRSKKSVRLMVMAGTLLYGLGLGTATASTRVGRFDSYKE